MQWEDTERKINEHYTEIKRLFKCLNKASLPKCEIVQENSKLLIKEFNNLTKLVDSIDNEEHKQHYENIVASSKEKLKSLLIYLNEKVDLPIPSEFSIPHESKHNQEEKMTQSTIDILRLFAQTINKNYSGDPLGLPAFINSIELLESVVTSDNINTLKMFILSKLESKALEAIPTNPETIQIIKNALKEKIKPDSSKIIEGRMLALKHDNMTHQEFAKTAEDLADSLKRTLIVEGISQEKANELTIEKTVQMCRTTTRSNLVKSIIASSTFPDAKTVIAKFIIETTNESKESQILSYKSANHSNISRRNYARNTVLRHSYYNPNFNKNFNPNNYTNRKYRNRYNSNSINKSNRWQPNIQRTYRNTNVRVADSGNSADPREPTLGDHQL